MIALAVIILFYLLIRNVVVLYNFAIQPYLIQLVPEHEPLISILIPARNEEDNIGSLLKQISSQTYRRLEVLVYDDQSDDRTAEIVTRFSENDERVKLVKGLKLPEGWLGKNHACYQLAKASNGDYLMFMDADVRPEAHLASSAVGYLQHKKAGLLSIFPHQFKKTMGEQLTVSLMYDILLTLLPLAFVRKSRRPVFSGANGQFMLFERSVYMEHQPHWWKKDQAVEDIAIMQLFKKFNIRCITLLGGDDISCRMYNSGTEAINGFAKNVIRFFGNSIAFTLFHVLVTTSGLVIMLLMPDFRFLSMYLIGVLVYKAVVGRLSQESMLKAWILIIPRQLMFITVVIRALSFRFRQNYSWKGRKIKI
ncbi:glycosyltransferase [Saccharicrinis sp. FJH54]|uniref:glycosyltransferase n=1 Tax=Saccharicrinis sp. FJH54 TaxID=3344665 RepID=UPI0035D4CE5F